MTNYTIV